MKKEKRFYRRPRPIAYFLSRCTVAACLLTWIWLYCIDYYGTPYVTVIFGIVIITCLAWMNAHRYKQPYLIANQHGIVANGLIKYFIPWSNIRGFDAIKRGAYPSLTRDIVIVSLKSLKPIQHKNIVSWFLHRLPLLYAWLDGRSGLYQRHLRWFAEGDPKAEKLLLTLRRFYKDAKARKATAQDGSFFVRDLEYLDKESGEIVLENPVNTMKIILVILGWGLYFLLWYGAIFTNPREPFRLYLGIAGWTVVSLTSITTFRYGLSRKPQLETGDDGLRIRQSGVEYHVAWDNIKALGFVRTRSKHGEGVVHYHALFVDAKHKDKIEKKYNLGWLGRLNSTPCWLGNVEHDIIHTRARHRRFPEDLPARLRRRMERALG